MSRLIIGSLTGTAGSGTIPSQESSGVTTHSSLARRPTEIGTVKVTVVGHAKSPHSLPLFTAAQSSPVPANCNQLILVWMHQNISLENPTFFCGCSRCRGCTRSWCHFRITIKRQGWHGRWKHHGWKKNTVSGWMSLTLMDWTHCLDPGNSQFQSRGSSKSLACCSKTIWTCSYLGNPWCRQRPYSWWTAPSHNILAAWKRQWNHASFPDCVPARERQSRQCIHHC